MFETASFHIVKPCNMKCKFCYATFDDMHVGTQLSESDAKSIIKKLKDSGVEKLTFAGGEPLLYKHLRAVIIYAKTIGLTTSIITNGSLLTYSWLSDMRWCLDWIGISVDSLNEGINIKIGRTAKNCLSYYDIVTMVNLLKYRLKINTVVNAFNKEENMNDFINWAKPDRWKVFQALRVEGQNDKQFDEVKIDEYEFNTFLRRHSMQHALVPENNEAMTGSYLLIDPQGRLFENSKGKHTYSSPLQDSDMETCLNQINLNREMFIKRGGLYSW